MLKITNSLPLRVTATNSNTPHHKFTHYIQHHPLTLNKPPDYTKNNIIKNFISKKPKYKITGKYY